MLLLDPAPAAAAAAAVAVASAALLAALFLPLFVMALQLVKPAQTGEQRLAWMSMDPHNNRVAGA